MRFIGAFTGILVTASLSLMLISVAASAQESKAAAASQPSDAPGDNTYRAEILIIERKVAPSEVAEKMASRHPKPAEGVVKDLWVEDESGQRHSDLDLVPRKDLYLSSAADRLERSGRFKVLAAAGWVQSFPPGYKGEKMKVAVGDWMDQVGQRDIEGYISIDRLRFLHVTVALNHWQPVNPAPATADGPLATTDPGTTSPASRQDQPLSQPASTAAGNGLPSAGPVSAPAPESHKQLLTWIRETRRMRSEEIHFLDSPTIGVLVYFKRIEPEAAPAQ